MASYNIVPVYRCDMFDDTFGLHLSRGKLLDKIRYKRIKGLSWKNVQEEQFQYCEDEDIPDDEMGCFLVYRIKSVYRESGEQKYTNWMTEKAMECLKEEQNPEFMEAVDDAKCVWSQEVLVLFTGSYVNQPFPTRVRLEYDQRQTLSVRFNCTPNWDGVACSGKLFFPDRSWAEKGIFAGEAKVSLKFETDRYGILVGEMLIPKAPTRQDMLDFIWRTHVAGNTFIYTLKHELFDNRELHAVRAPQEVQDPEIDCVYLDVFAATLKSQQNPEGVRYMRIGLTLEQYESAVSDTTTINDFVLRDTFGEGVTVTNLLGHFVECGFKCTRVSQFAHNSDGLPDRPLDAVWAPTDDYTDTEGIDSAVQRGIIQVEELGDYRIYRVVVNVDEIVSFCEYSVTDILLILEACSRINKDATEKIQEKLRNGKLRFL